MTVASPESQPDQAAVPVDPYAWSSVSKSESQNV